MHSQQQQNKSIKQTNSLPQLYDGWNNVQTLTPKDQSTELSENGMKRTYCNQCCSFRLRLIFHTMCVDFLRLWHNFFHASSFSYFVVGRVFAYQPHINIRLFSLFGGLYAFLVSCLMRSSSNPIFRASQRKCICASICKAGVAIDVIFYASNALQINTYSNNYHLWPSNIAAKIGKCKNSNLSVVERSAQANKIAFRWSHPYSTYTYLNNCFVVFICSRTAAMPFFPLAHLHSRL